VVILTILNCTTLADASQSLPKRLILHLDELRLSQLYADHFVIQRTARMWLMPVRLGGPTALENQRNGCGPGPQAKALHR